jgi:oxygen-independent coproporphyrinogen-3 oxidase
MSTIAVPAAGTRLALAALPPLALYVHIPWCVRKCPYCDFNSHEVRGEFPEADYIDALIADLELALPQVWGRRVSSVFIGGGTPSLLQPAAVDRLLTAVRTRLHLMPDAEITLEANPGTVDADRFQGFRAAGVSRLSLGVQSFEPKHLAAIGRIHDGREAHAAVELAMKHFADVNLDLMYALPRQTLHEARRDVETAAGYGVPHLSAYHLTLEPNTAFQRNPPPLPDPDLAADMQDMAEELLASHGYQHYETSAFARPGRRCRHNLNYWLFGDYLGIGAGAHGKLSYHDRIEREMRHRQPQAYLDAVRAGSPLQERRVVTGQELPFEFMMNALRLIEGFAPRLYAERTGLSLDSLRTALGEAQRRALLSLSADRIAPTELGRRFLNDLLEIFLDAPGR